MKSLSFYSPKRVLITICFVFVFNSLWAKDLSVMFYNVENLFDNLHLTDNEDWTYTPFSNPGKEEGCRLIKSSYYRKNCFQTDWTEEHLGWKLNQIHSVVSKGRSIPDFLGLGEVENKNVLKLLATQIGYEEVQVTSGSDSRGINVGFLYKKSSEYRLISVRELKVEGLEHTTRNILECQFMMEDGTILAFFVNHWPSQSNPTENRLAVSNVLSNRINELLQEKKETKIIIMGDFNTLETEYPNPIQQLIESVGPVDLVDLHDLKMKAYQDQDTTNVHPEGTHFYEKNKTWSRFDRIIVSSNLLGNQPQRVKQSTYHLKFNSFKIYAPKFITKKTTDDEGQEVLVPNRYNFSATKKSEAGYSDHFPVEVGISSSR